MLILLLTLAVAIIAFQQVRIVRLRESLDEILPDEAAQSQAETEDSVSEAELESLKKRLQVLERIATDRATALEEEIESLRRR